GAASSRPLAVIVNGEYKIHRGGVSVKLEAEGGRYCLVELTVERGSIAGQLVLDLRQTGLHLRFGSELTRREFGWEERGGNPACRRPRGSFMPEFKARRSSWCAGHAIIASHLARVGAE